MHTTEQQAALTSLTGRSLLPARPGTGSGSGSGSTAAERLTAAFLRERRGRTREAYARDLTHYGSWCAAHDIDVLTARRTHVEGYLRHLAEEGAAPATTVRRLAAISGFYTRGVAEGMLECNPAARVRRPKVGNGLRSTGLSAAEAASLLAAAERRSPRTAATVGLLLFCGLRVSELVAARVTDLSHERGHRMLSVTRKGGRRQKVVVPPRAVSSLDRYLDGRTEGPLIATAGGNPLDRHAIWRLLRTLAKDALPHLAATLHPHDLRRACATLALDAGASVRDVQHLLGHQDTRTTRRYERARHGLDRSPVHALASLVTSPPARPAPPAAGSHS